jgi:hypothetical protein
MTCGEIDFYRFMTFSSSHALTSHWIQLTSFRNIFTLSFAHTSVHGSSSKQTAHSPPTLTRSHTLPALTPSRSLSSRPLQSGSSKLTGVTIRVCTSSDTLPLMMASHSHTPHWFYTGSLHTISHSQSFSYTGFGSHWFKPCALPLPLSPYTLPLAPTLSLASCSKSGTSEQHCSHSATAVRNWRG